MKKFLVVVGILAGLLIIGVIILFFSIKAALKPEKVSAMISKKIEASLHHKVTLGPVITGFSSATVQGFTLLPNNNRDKTPLVSIKRVSLTFSLLPLLKKKLDIKKVVISSPNFYVVRGKDGKLNWQEEFKKVSLRRENSVGQKPSTFSFIPAAYAAEAADSGRKGFTVEVGKVEMESGTIVWVDRTLTPTYKATLGSVELELDNFSLTRPFKYEMKGTLKRQGKTHFSLKGSFDLASKDLDGKISLDSPSLSDFSPYLKGRGIKIQKGAGTLKFEVASKRLNTWKVEEDLDLKGVKVSSNGRSTSPISATLKGKIRFDREKQTLDLEDLTGNVADSDFTLKGSLQKLRSTPTGAFEFQSKKMDLDTLMGLFGFTQKASEGEKKAETSKAKTKGKSLSAGRKPAPKKPLHPFPNLKVKVNIDLLLVKKVKIEKLRALIMIHAHEAVLNPFTAELYGGTVKGKLTVDLSSGVPVIKKQISINNVDIAPLLSDMNPHMKEKFAGHFFGKAQGGGTLGAPSTFHGDISFHVENGAIQHVKALTLAAAILKLPSLNNLKFDEMKGNATVHNRLIDIRNVDAKGKDLLFDTHGTIGFDKKLNLNAHLKLPYKVIRKGLGKRSDLFADEKDASGKKWSIIPIMVRGTTSRPLVTVKFEKKAVEKIIEKNIHDKKIRNLLKKLF